MNPAAATLASSRLIRVVCLCLALFSAGATLPAQVPPRDTFRYRVDVGLVLVPASVITKEGQPLTTLGRDDFEIYEDGELRPLQVFEKSTQLPLQLALLIDTSLSAAKELPSQKASVSRFISRVLRSEDAAALLDFSGETKTQVEFSSDHALLEAGLKEIKVKAGTALYDAVIEAAALLQEREGRRVMILVTDGNDTTSKSDYHAALRAAQEVEATIYALITRPIAGESGRSVRGEHVLISYAEMTGGQVFFPSVMAELDRFFDELSEVLRTQYLLGFAPGPGAARDDFRTIEVRVKGGGHVVRHRKGYYPQPQP